MTSFVILELGVFRWGGRTHWCLWRLPKPRTYYPAVTLAYGAGPHRQFGREALR